MKTIFFERTVNVPDGVSAHIKCRNIEVKGPLGSISKDFRHVKMQLYFSKKRQIAVRIWNGGKKQNACVRTIATHINNMIIGVTKGFKYKMKLVYAHFPINSNIVNDGTVIEIRNFLGESVVRRVKMLPGVKVQTNTAQKDEIFLTGVDVQTVSQSAASIRQACLVKNKDIRKFLDGIYVFEKGTDKE